MTNQEAIRLIRNLPTMCEFTDAYGESIDSDAYYEAIELAISALQVQDVPDINVGDMVSRQKAIDAFYKHPNNNWTTLDVLTKINALPSAQPDHVADIGKKAEAEDCISRKAALDTIMGQPPEPHYPSWYAAQIEILPAVQPDHTADVSKKVERTDESAQNVQNGDLIQRKAAIEAIKAARVEDDGTYDWRTQRNLDLEFAAELLETIPSAQPERDIPIKPVETTDTAWGIPHRQAVCPKCDYYLGHVVFLGDGKGKKVTYCETCGQAIDWEGWDFDE